MRNHAADGNAVVLVGSDVPGELTIYCVDKSGKVYGTERLQADTFEDHPDYITEMVADNIVNALLGPMMPPTDFNVDFERGEFPFIKEGRRES
jgi:hypothetical protein